MELKGSKTEANLWIAFAGESQARNKYDYFASKAKKEGYEQIAAIFQETALNEKEHAKLWFKALDGIGSTEENLVAAAAGENEEWTKMYAEDVYKRQAAVPCCWPILSPSFPPITAPTTWTRHGPMTASRHCWSGWGDGE